MTIENTENTETAEKNPPRYLREPDVLARVPLSAPTLHRLCREGLFPRPVKVGARAVAWLTSEIDEWDAQRIAERDATSQKRIA